MFRFKNFSVSHSRSSMKIGVDAVLIGSWAAENASEILDVGCGCGIISLMMAQRFPEAQILGLDIHPESVEESRSNFVSSPWSRRLKAIEGEFPIASELCERKFDLIISNPPFFASGLTELKTPRERARHQASLSVESLLKHSKDFLIQNGVLAMIFPENSYGEALSLSY